MGVACGSQASLCEFPVRLDTYSGCSHGCRYCFAQAKTDIAVVRPDKCVKQVMSFAGGGRTVETNWCDWRIPLHWGGLSDPFQPAEREHGVSLEVLKVLRETQYPFIVSTKGVLVSQEPYLTLLSECNAVVQISMVCSKYDRMEPGAPTFEERVEMLRRLEGNVKKLVVRAQPYMTQVRDEFVANIPRIAEAGADAVTVEGMKFKRKKPGLVRVGGDFCYPEERLRGDYEAIREACHEAGIGFFCAENRLRSMGDGTACCGCGDVEGFEGNGFNAVSLLNGSGAGPTEAMRRAGTAACFKSVYQDPGMSAVISRKSFEEMQLRELMKLAHARR